MIDLKEPREISVLTFLKHCFPFQGLPVVKKLYPWPFVFVLNMDKFSILGVIMEEKVFI